MSVEVKWGNVMIAGLSVDFEVLLMGGMREEFDAKIKLSRFCSV